MNPVAMTINNPQKEYWPSRGSNQSKIYTNSVTHDKITDMSQLIVHIQTTNEICLFKNDGICLAQIEQGEEIAGL